MTAIQVETSVRPTENPMKVRAAVLNIFPDASFTEVEGRLSAEAHSLELLKELFRTQRIRDTARWVLLKSRDESSIRFSLNKQTAFVGKANFAPPSPMGPITVTIEDEDLDAVIRFLTEKPEAEVPHSARGRTV